jgi:streptogrisin C
MRKYVAWAVSPLVLAISMAAVAAPGDLPSPTMRATMKRDLNMTDAQLSQYLGVERLAATHRSALAKSLDLHYAGSWIERKPNGDYAFVVATTAPDMKGAPKGVTVRQARHSLAKLEESKAELDQFAQPGAIPAGLYAWGVDVRTNAVTLDVAPGAEKAAIDFVAASGADASTIRLNLMESAPRPLVTLQGGSEYLSQSGGSYYYCSVGFGVTRSGIEAFVTAGHCGDTNDGVFTLANRRTVGPQIGSFKSSFFGGSGDGAHVELFGGHSVSATVAGYNQPVRGMDVAPEGAAVCRSGRTTGLKCGTILKYDQTVNYPEATINGLTSVKVCAEGGDSGGSFISGDQAQGVLSGGNYSCKGKQAALATSYFQPLAEILGSQLTLKTSN